MPSNSLLVVTPPPRRSWPLAEKRRIVELTLQRGASVQSVAKEYQLDPPTLSSWRTLYRKGSLDIVPHAKELKQCQPEFLPVMIHATPTIKSPGSLVVTMQIPGEITLKIEAETIDLAALGSFVAAIKQSI